MLNFKHIFSFSILVLLCVGSVSAQLFPERGDIRRGNRDYEAQQWEDALKHYGTGLSQNPASWEAAMNLGSALYRMGQYAQADSLYSQVTKHPLLTPEQRARAFYNLGNDQFQSAQYDKAVESYKNSLRWNPDDMEAKFNLAYAQKMLQKQQQQGGGDKEKNDQNNNDQDSGGGGDNEQQQTQSGNDQNEGEQSEQTESEAQAEPRGISREDAEKLLEAIQQQEDNTAEKVKEDKAKKTAGQKGKNW